MKLKKWLTGVLAAAMALSLAACSDGGAESADAGSEDSITLGFAQVGSESEWRTANTDNIKAAAEAAGVTLQFSDAQQKQENQIKAIRSFIASDVDVISFCPIVETGWDTVLQEAKDAGIPVVLVDRGVTACPAAVPDGLFPYFRATAQTTRSSAAWSGWKAACSGHRSRWNEKHPGHRAVPWR